MKLKHFLLIVIAAVFFFSEMNTTVFADGTIEVLGKVYSFTGKNSTYEFDETTEYTVTNNTNTYGKFFVNGDFSNLYEKEGYPFYEINSGTVKFSYIYNDGLLNKEETEWHLDQDNSRNINDIKLDSKIKYGAILLYSSVDGINWNKLYEATNVFEDTPTQSAPFYETNDLQLTNGTYYRIMVAYKLSIVTEKGKIVVIPTKKEEYKKHLEIYDFYLKYHDSNNENTEKCYLTNADSRVNTGSKDNGYSGNEPITKDDPHFNWNLGNFSMQGFTSYQENNDSPVFLKNYGDSLVLNFELEQNINQLNGNEALSIQSDTDGYDQQLGVNVLNDGFGKGTLIIRQTDYQKLKHPPVIYTNFLEASTSTEAETKININEEGDYEVALDYEVRCKKNFLDLFPEINHYRIYFKFSVRNGNCMLFPKDIVTTSDLSNGSSTANGFYIDLAESHYLKTNVKRIVFSNGSLVEDTKYNRPAKDGDRFTEEGIYTIEVTNEYTNQKTEIKIYVGNNKVMKAHVKTGMDLNDIHKGIDEGTITIDDDGNVTFIPSVEPITPDDKKEDNKEKDDPTEKDTNNNYLIYGITGISLAIVVVVLSLKRKNIVIANNKVNINVEKNTSINASSNKHTEVNVVEVTNEETTNEKDY